MEYRVEAQLAISVLLYVEKKNSISYVLYHPFDDDVINL